MHNQARKGTSPRFPNQTAHCFISNAGDCRPHGAIHDTTLTLFVCKTEKATYDQLAREHEFRYIPGVTPRARGGEDVLLDDLERLGLKLGTALGVYQIKDDVFFAGCRTMNTIKIIDPQSTHATHHAALQH